MKRQRFRSYGLPTSPHVPWDEGGVFIELWLEVFAPGRRSRLRPADLWETNKSPQEILDALRVEAARQRRENDGLP